MTINQLFSSTVAYINYLNLLQYSVGGIHETSLLRNVDFSKYYRFFFVSKTVKISMMLKI